MAGLKHIVNTSEDEQVKRVIRLYQRSTSIFRALPHFLVIGAMKAGTSSLYKYLVQHPLVLSSTKKEVHFFDWNFEKGPQWYKAHFPLKKNVPEGVQLGEASPIYIFDPRVPMRIKGLLPHVKLIAILRNPTERAISQYFQEVRKKRENLPILEAMQSEEQRISNALQQKDYDDYAYKYFSYKKRGIYVEQLSRYWEYFSKDQLLVLNSEAFFAEPQETLRKIYEFLNIDTSIEIQDLAPKNVGKNRKQVPEAVYEYLDDFFKLHNQALYKAIDQDFGW